MNDASSGRDQPTPRGTRRAGEDPRLRQRYRVLRMEPLVGDDRRDERTEPSPGTKGSMAGPTMQAGREYEGQTVTLEQLAGMGRLNWESDRVARLDTASESYRIELEPLPDPDRETSSTPPGAGAVAPAVRPEEG